MSCGNDRPVRFPVTSLVTDFPDSLDGLGLTGLGAWAVNGMPHNIGGLLTWDNVTNTYPGFDGLVGMQVGISVVAGDVVQLSVRITCHAVPQGEWWKGPGKPLLQSCHVGSTIDNWGQVTYDVEMAGPASSFSAAFPMSPGGG